MNTRKLQLAPLLIALFLLSVAAHAQTKITSPKEQLGFNLGDD